MELVAPVVGRQGIFRPRQRQPPAPDAPSVGPQDGPGVAGERGVGFRGRKTKGKRMLQSIVIEKSNFLKYGTQRRPFVV